MRRLALGIFAALSWTSVIRSQETPAEKNAAAPLAQAHAHNDYLHPRPLLDALAHGFTSVEADIHLVDGKLLVAHDRKDARPERTFETLYLDPLRERVRKNDGRVWPAGPELTLLIDVKTSGEETYRALRDVLGRYEEMLTSLRDGKLEVRAVRAIVSGERPRGLIAADPKQLAAFDGRLADLESTEPAHFMPLISDNWRNHFAWRGEGPFPTEEREKLRRIVTQAHQRGRRVRFWATPDVPAVWKELLEAGVDAINTDDLAGLAKFLSERRSADPQKKVPQKKIEQRNPLRE